MRNVGVGSFRRYRSPKASSSSSDRRSFSSDTKYNGNSAMLASPSTPASSSILSETSVRLGTQNMENS
jgi:hypothetical protein